MIFRSTNSDLELGDTSTHPQNWITVIPPEFKKGERYLIQKYFPKNWHFVEQTST